VILPVLCIYIMLLLKKPELFVSSISMFVLEELRGDWFFMFIERKKEKFAAKA